MEIVVTRQSIHGLPASDYAAALRDRLPDHEITLAETPDAEATALSRARVATGSGRRAATRLDAATELELLACVYAGTSHLDLSAFEAAGVAVTNAAGVHGPNVAEYVVGALISLARDFRRATRQQDRHEWASYQCRELFDSTVCVVGLGAIGTAVAERLEPFGVERVGVRHTPEKGGPLEQVYGYDGLHEAVAGADHLVCACPLTDETAGLIDRAAFATLPSHASLVNVARGPVVETDALVDAVRWNRIGGAFLDVTDPEPLPPDHPLWRFEDVRVTPHNAGHSPAYYERTADILAENVARLADDSSLQNRVV